MYSETDFVFCIKFKPLPPVVLIKSFNLTNLVFSIVHAT